jgi:hypothetical protein
MAWDTTFPIDGSYDWTTAVFLQQFIRALRERQGALGQTLETQPQDGAEITWSTDPCDATHFNIGRIQQWIDQNQGSFLDTSVTYETANPLWYGGVNTYCYNANNYAGYFKKVYATAGVGNGQGFTRNNDGINFGIAQDGDCVGPWIFNELWACFNCLKWTSVPATWADGSAYHGHFGV